MEANSTTDLQYLVRNMRPVIYDTEKEYVFAKLDRLDMPYTHLDPLCMFVEREGRTLILTKIMADKGLKSTLIYVSWL